MTTTRPDWVVLPFTTQRPQLPIKSFTDVDDAAAWARDNEPYLGAWTVRAAHDSLIDWSDR